ncbi:MAG TPA: transglutaminase N-terminal domain-containing protein [Desulfobacterales bacterium]
MRYRIVHRTEYVYHAPVSLCYNEARLMPRATAAQTPAEAALVVEPTPLDMRRRTDFFGNAVVFFSIQQPHETLRVTATSQVTVHPQDPRPAAGGDLPWREARRRLAQGRSDPDLDARQYTAPSPRIQIGAAVHEYARTVFSGDRGLLESTAELMHRIYGDFEYLPGTTTITTPLETLAAQRRGVCQDFAHFAIGCLRSLGLSARYVSGYIETLPPAGQVQLKGADASHAWFAVYLPGTGWFDFDPTNEQQPGAQHVTVAWGRDYADVVPLKGVIFSSGTHEMRVAVDVERIES